MIMMCKMQKKKLEVKKKVFIILPLWIPTTNKSSKYKMKVSFKKNVYHLLSHIIIHWI